MSGNAFDGESGGYFVSGDDEERGRRPHQAGRAACLEGIDQTWTHVQEKGWRERLAAG